MTMPSGTFFRGFLTWVEMGTMNSTPMNRKNASPSRENTSPGFEESTSGCSTTCPVPSLSAPMMPRNSSEPISPYATIFCTFANISTPNRFSPSRIRISTMEYTAPGMGTPVKTLFSVLPNIAASELPMMV